MKVYVVVATHSHLDTESMPYETFTVEAVYLSKTKAQEHASPAPNDFQTDYEIHECEVEE